MGSAFSGQPVKRARQSDPVLSGYAIYDLPVHNPDDTPNQLANLQEELELLKIARDRETMEMVRYQLAIIKSLEILKRKLILEKRKTARAWSAYCRLKYTHMYALPEDENHNRILFDFSFALMVTLRTIRQWRNNFYAKARQFRSNKKGRHFRCR